MPDREFSESNGYSTAGLSYICLLVDAVKKMPPRAQLTALQIAGKTVPVNSANDVLVSLAKHLWTFKGWKLQRIIRTRELGWLRTTRYGMANPYQIDQDCYIDLNGSGSTPFLRALKLIEWCNLSNDDVRVTYRDSNANEDANSPRLSHSADDVEKTNESSVQYGQEGEEFAKCDKSEQGIDELLISSGILKNRVRSIMIEGCRYDVADWTACFNAFVVHCFTYHQKKLTKFNYSPWWRWNAWPIVRYANLDPLNGEGAEKYEVVLTTVSDPIRLLSAMSMIRRSCGLRPCDVEIVCSEKLFSAEAVNGFVSDAAPRPPKVPCEGQDGIRKFSYISDTFDEVTGTTPVALSICGKEYPLNGKWVNLPIQLCAVLDEMYPGKLREIVEHGLIGRLSLSGNRMQKGYYLEGSGVWLERNMSSCEIVRQTRKLVQQFGIRLTQVFVLYIAKNATRERSSYEREDDAESRKNAAVLEQDIRANYTAGFDFSASAKRLVEGRTGCAFSTGVICLLQDQMFQRKDGLWFFTDQISEDSLRNDIVDRCRRWIEEVPLVCLGQFVEMIGVRTTNLEDDSDRAKYAEYLIARSGFGRTCEFEGKRGGRICFSQEVGVEGAKKAFAEKVETLLRDRFDLVPLLELAESFPMVSAEWMCENLPKLIQNVILEDFGDKTYALKLLEYYYLPDDFSDVFNSVVEGLAADGETLSVSRILRGLNEWYGYDFRENFALSESAFKQIATRVDKSHREWKGSILCGVDECSKKSLRFEQIVEKQFPRIFMFDEFWEFAETTWSLRKGSREPQNLKLWKRCIRYDADHWSSISYFKRTTGWNAELEKKLTDAMTELLGTNLYFALGRVPQGFLDRLPDLEIEGRCVRWTPELLTSVAYFCLPQVRILNHAVASYTVTSLLVPPTVAADTDAIAYMVHLFKLRNPHAPSGENGDLLYVGRAISFLQENNVRNVMRQGLQAKVAALLKREEA